MRKIGQVESDHSVLSVNSISRGYWDA